jgi:hypothetical protein
MEKDLNNFLNLLNEFIQLLKECGTNNPFENKDNTNPIFVYALLLCDASHCIDEIRGKLVELNQVKERNKELELRTRHWKNLIPSSFSCIDGKFANHDCDKNVAKEIREIVWEEKIDLKFVVKEFHDFLTKGFPNRNKENESEMKKIEEFFRKRNVK